MHRYLQIILLVSFTMLIQGCSDKTDNESNNSSSSSISSVNDADNNSSLSTSSSANSTPANSSSSTQQVVTSSSTIAVVTSSSSSTTSSSSSVIVVHSSSSSPIISPTLTLTADNTTLNKDENTTIKVIATYSDGSSKDVTGDVEWVKSPVDSLEIHSSSLKALLDTNTTLQATLESTTSNTLALNIYWKTPYHTLPPQPDMKINNSTLLGIDTNNNGVRDDVERWIYERYDEYIPCEIVDINITHLQTGKVTTIGKKVCEEHKIPYHQIVREILMQGARAWQIVIEEPERAKEMVKYSNAVVACNAYFSPKLIDGYLFGDEFKNIQLNTVKRTRAYMEYNSRLAGVYDGVFRSEQRAKCDFDVDALLKNSK